MFSIKNALAVVSIAHHTNAANGLVMKNNKVMKGRWSAKEVTKQVTKKFPSLRTALTATLKRSGEETASNGKKLTYVYQKPEVVRAVTDFLKSAPEVSLSDVCIELVLHLGKLEKATTTSRTQWLKTGDGSVVAGNVALACRIAIEERGHLSYGVMKRTKREDRMMYQDTGNKIGKALKKWAEETVVRQSRDSHVVAEKTTHYIQKERRRVQELIEFLKAQNKDTTQLERQLSALDRDLAHAFSKQHIGAETKI